MQDDEPVGWRDCLADRRFVESGERRQFWLVPPGLRLPGNSALEIVEVGSNEAADEFAAIHAVTYRIPRRLRRWDRELARIHAISSDERFYLGKLEGKAVAAIACRFALDRVAGLWGLAVLPDARHRGVGTAMLARAIDDARATGADTVFFTTAWANQAEALYRKLGIEQLFATSTFELDQTVTPRSRS